MDCLQEFLVHSHLPVRLRLLGATSVLVGRTVVNTGSNNAVGRLGYLAWRRTATLLSEIDSSLWPESDHVEGRRRLRGELLRLNTLLPPGTLMMLSQYVRLSSLCEVV